MDSVLHEDMIVYENGLMDDLNERFEKLVLQRIDSAYMNEDHRRRVSDKFANKSLQELNDMVCQLSKVQSTQ